MSLDTTIRAVQKKLGVSLDGQPGAWQVSADSLGFGQDLKDLVKREVGTLWHR